MLHGPLAIHHNFQERPTPYWRDLKASRRNEVEANTDFRMASSLGSSPFRILDGPWRLHAELHLADREFQFCATHQDRDHRRVLVAWLSARGR